MSVNYGRLTVSVLSVFLNSLGGFLASFAALFVWFHYDIEGYFEHRKHDRLVRRGKRLEEKAKQAKIDTLTHEFKHTDERDRFHDGYRN